MIPRRLTNLCLAGFLVAMTFASMGHLSAIGWVDMVDTLAYSAATLLLVINSLRRSEAVATDQRWWVWLLCLASTLSFLCYEGSAPLLIVVVAVHILGDLGLIYLGNSFSIMPARREIKRGLFYRVVRHPVYATYALADLAFVSQVPSIWNLGVSMIAIALYVLRAKLEEDLLLEDWCYREYCRETRFRFLPGIY